MNERKIAITKNGYDILRIIEMSSDGSKCDFKICPQINPIDVNINCMRLFSEPFNIEFDRNKELQITYHKAKDNKRTKIHLLLTNKENKKDFRYITLPLIRLLDPNVNTEIPIPLFQIKISDKVLYKKYKKEKEHVQFEIEDNNIVEIYLTKNGYINSNLFDKWENLNLMLCTTPIELFATGLVDKYAGYHIKTIGENTRCMAKSADVTSDIGVRINTIKYPYINTDKMDFLFIENAAYLGVLAGMKRYNQEATNFKLAYEYDLNNHKYFNIIEKEKWERIFYEELKRLDNWIALSNGKYDRQFKNFKEIIFI